MEARLLGTVEVWGAGGQIPLGPRQQRCVFAVLAMSPGQQVTTRTLIDRVWGDRPPRDVLNALYTNVSRLRRALAPANWRLLRQDVGYLLEVDPDRVDLHRVRRLVAEARALTSNAPARAAELLRDAGELWRGAPLAGLKSDWAARVRESLELERLEIIIDRYDLELRLGRHAAVIAALAAERSAYPLSEPLAALQMLALYQCGRQPEALEVYARTRRHVVDELGVEPGTALRRVYEHVLRRDPELAARPALPAVPATQTPRELPADVAGFTGRVDALRALHQLLQDRHNRSATLVPVAIAGTAGVGKTALAVHWAHRIADRFPDGQMFIDLHGFTQGVEPIDPGEALDRVLRTLGVPEAQMPSSVDERAALYRTRLADRQMLIMIDNAATETQVRSLLPGSAGSLVLVTSRHRLAGLDHTHTLSLDPLPSADAITLFLRTSGEDRLATEPPTVVAEVVELCGRLPLAIRIAAARLRAHPTWSLAHLLERLRDQRHRLVALEAGQRSVTAALDLSYQHLSVDQQCTYRLLGLHPGVEVDEYATAALRGSNLWQANKMLDQLLEAHLLHEPVPGRYRFHDLTRVHAAHTATRDPSEPTWRTATDRLLDYYRHTASLAMDAAYPYERERRPQVPPAQTIIPELSDPASALGWLDIELPSLLAVARYAAEHARPAYILHLSAILHRHLSTRGRYRDAETLHRAALTIARSTGDQAQEMDPLICLGVVYRRQGRHAQAADQFEHALQIARTSGHRSGELDARCGFGQVYRLQGRYAQAADQFEHALQIARTSGDRTGELEVLVGLGQVYRQQGRYAWAADQFKHALQIARTSGHRSGELTALTGLGWVHMREGRYGQATDNYQQASQLAGSIGHYIGELNAQLGLGQAYRLQGRYEQAVDYYQRVLDLTRGTNNRNGQFEALQGLGRLLHTTGHPETAIAHHAQALALACELGQPDDQARAYDGLARAYRALNQHEQARRHWQRALHVLTSIGLDHTDDDEANLRAIRAHLADLDRTDGSGTAAGKGR